MTVWALLDSPGATGAFSFTIRPGHAHGGRRPRACCSSRNDISLLGIAPLTSMFFSGKATPARDDYRPEIHDSDGLFMLTGKGERIWRPLDNPGGSRRLVVQRHQPARLRPDAARARLRALPGHRRAPTSAAEPVGRTESATGATARCGWSRSRRQAETNDNIVAFWVSRWPAKKGEPSWSTPTAFTRCRTRPRFRRPAGSWRRASARSRPAQGAAHGGRVRRRRARRRSSRNNRSKPTLSLTNGKVLRTYVEALPWQTRWRLFIDFEPDGKKPVDLRAVLQAARRRR